MATVSQLKGDVFVHKASHLYYTPWAINVNDAWAPTAHTYDIVDILADTISIEQGDPETETVDWEFGDTPLMSSTTKGERTITADCIDMSFDIMEKVFGWTRETSGSSDVLVAEGASAETYATITIFFHSTAAPIIVLPKVSMSAKTTIGTLKTSTGSAQISGTALQAYISYQSKTATTEFAFLKPTDGSAIAIANSETAAGTTGNLVEIGDIDTETNGEYKLVTTV